MGDQDSRAGQSYATKAIADYCDRTHVPRDSGLLRAFNGPQTHALPDIMVGLSEARFLELLVMLTQPKKVVEVGTLAGFSALAMARALPSEGRIWTIENDPKHASVARANIKAAGYADRVEVVLGDAESALSQIEVHGPFDLVFLDADKERYDIYQSWATRHLRTGGLLLADNAYYFGHLLDQNEDAAAVRRMHEQTAASFDSVCLPTPDGLVLGIKR